MPWAPWIMKLAMRGVRRAAHAIELPVAAHAARLDTRPAADGELESRRALAHPGRAR
jgi:hypothetical protein